MVSTHKSCQSEDSGHLLLDYFGAVPECLVQLTDPSDHVCSEAVGQHAWRDSRRCGYDFDCDTGVDADCVDSIFDSGLQIDCDAPCDDDADEPPPP
jgi:hypothetical protein